MKKTLYFFLFFLFTALLKPYYSLASHYAGEDIFVEYVGTGPLDLKYKITLIVYRSCEPGNAPMSSSEGVCVADTCNGVPGQINFMLDSNGTNSGYFIDGLCPAYTSMNSCYTTSAGWPGLQKTVYTKIVTLPYRCETWIFTTNSCCRSGGINGFSSSEISVRCKIDNRFRFNISTPHFLVDPSSYLCVNQPDTMYNYPVDPDGDSLFTWSKIPADGSCTANTTLTYGAGYSIANPVNASVSNPYTVDSSNGMVTFMSTANGKYTLAYQADKYDRQTGFRIAYTQRDMLVWVLTCPSTLPNPFYDSLLTNLSTTLTHISGNSYLARAHYPFSFQVNAHGQSTSSLLSLGCYNAGTIGSTFSSTGAGTPNVSGTYSWAPPKAGVYNVLFKALDSNCTTSQPLALIKYLWVTIYVLPDTAGPCTSLAIGGVNDTTDVGMFVIGADTIGTPGAHLLNPAAIDSFTFNYSDTLVLYADSVYPVLEWGIMSTIHDVAAKVSLFIDFNHNFHYDIPQERLFDTLTQQWVYFVIGSSIYIPPTAVQDTPLIMRLIINNDTAASAASDSACGTYISGETEEYLVIIKPKPTSIGQYHAIINNLSIAPNPSNGRFKLNLNCSALIKQLQLNITTITGQNIYSNNYTAIDKQFNTEIDLSKIPKGLYFLTIDADGEKQTRKILIE